MQNAIILYASQMAGVARRIQTFHHIDAVNVVCMYSAQRIALWIPFIVAKRTIRVQPKMRLIKADIMEMRAKVLVTRLFEASSI